MNHIPRRAAVMGGPGQMGLRLGESRQSRVLPSLWDIISLPTTHTAAVELEQCCAANDFKHYTPISSSNGCLWVEKLAFTYAPDAGLGSSG